MLGTDLRSPGGITAVINSYLRGGLLELWPVRLLSTFHRNKLIDKLTTAALALSKFVWWLATRKVVAVHAHVAARGSFWRKAIFLTLGHAAGCRTVFHLHDGSFPSWYFSNLSRSQQMIVRWVLRSVDRVAVLTDGCVAAISRIETRATFVCLRNHVEIPATHSTHVLERVLFLARLRREKGVYDLLDALALVQPEFPNLSVVCAGAGDTDSVLRHATARGLAHCLELPGWVDGDRKTAHLSSAAVLVLPSYFEGLPICVLEAMAWVVPVIAT